MAFGVHPAENLGPTGNFIIDLALAKIGTSNEECSFDVVLLENVQYLVSVFVRAVIKGQGESPRSSAVSDIHIYVWSGWWLM